MYKTSVYKGKCPNMDTCCKNVTNYRMIVSSRHLANTVEKHIKALYYKNCCWSLWFFHVHSFLKYANMLKADKKRIFISASNALLNHFVMCFMWNFFSFFQDQSVFRSVCLCYFYTLPVNRHTSRAPNMGMGHVLLHIIQGVPKKRIPSFIFGITSVIQHRF